MLNSIWQDFRIGMRLLARSPSFTSMALLMLALGIGATTTIFSFVDAVLLKPLPYENADRIVRVLETRPNGATSWISTPDYLDWKSDNTVFEQLAAFQQGLSTLTGGDEPLPVRVGRVSANYFDVFGINAYLGRTFVEGEDTPGNERVLVLSYSLWQTQYGGDAGIVGQTVLVDDMPYTVVGVLPEDSAFNRSATQVWYPVAFESLPPSRPYRWINSTFGLLRPGVSLEQARSQMSAIADRLASEYPDSNRGWGAAVDGYADTIVAAPLRTSLLVLMAAVGGLLLICCANLASLTLTRALSRSGEVAVRISLGATRARMAQQFFCENLLLIGIGSALGIALAWAGVAWIPGFLPQGIVPREAEITLDARVLSFAVAVSIVSSLVFALAPLARAVRTDGSVGIGGGRRGATANRRTRRLLDGLVVTEIALSVVLVVCTAWLIQSFVGLVNVDTGFDARDTLTMSLPVPGFPPGSVYDDPAQFKAYLRQVEDAVGAIPGVDDVALTTALPLTNCCLYALSLDFEGRPAPDLTDRGVGFFKIVTPSYFPTLGLRLLEGRFLSDRDTAGGRPVIVINQRLANRYFPGESAIGHRILSREIVPGKTERGDRVAWEIVGVVQDETVTTLDDVTSVGAYASYEQSPAYFMNLIVGSSLDPATLERDIRSAVRSISSSQSILDVRTLDQLRAAAVGGNRFQTTLLGSFSGVALLFASIGLFGALMYGVARRSREIGIRAALGADRAALLGMVLRQGVGVTAIGLAIGLAAASAVAPLLSQILYEVNPLDPLLLGIVCAVFLAVSVLASVTPAIRAARIDPNAMLRAE